MTLSTASISSPGSSGRASTRCAHSRRLRDVHAVLVGRLVQQQDADRLRIQRGHPRQQLGPAHRPRAQPADEHVERGHAGIHLHAFRQPGYVPVQTEVAQQAFEFGGPRRVLTDNDYVHYDTFSAGFPGARRGGGRLASHRPDLRRRAIHETRDPDWPGPAAVMLPPPV